MKKILLVVAAAALMAGCTSDPLVFRKCDMSKAVVMGESEGEATGFMLFQVIPIGQNDRFKNAYAEAVSKLGGTCLMDPVIEEKWFWAYVMNGYSFKVKGTVVREGH
jgi:hypothetical protein